ncbi:efflux RND transporter periplasmic adaptor subunit [Leptolyngbya cf. ectocarpi LEGE 11479]|uniref:Efflux RND transporter periplasmic adaptor subunit n=1 Tax=Leptolyngbya cf. ectocarpi LEGE 11479 TaxID=1828722 RepID=A0A928ZTH5_LEPEC|nr:efflux RND transporter periplasmic adaptor subunit [Leptolyngbya ectocarpi]MBE9065504.1 efflux RND transporter periplasmic adaptor subunit [Leptolyngbya cf. ectocarpi LEGE 11479]
MVLLTLGILLPTLNNPESRIYSSDIGYPARQRQAGKPITMDTFVVGQGTVDQTVGAPGVSVALDDVNVRPEINGVVESVLVKEGDWVKKGQLLFRLRQDDLLTRVQQAQTDVMRSQTQLHQRTLEFAGRIQLLEDQVALAKARLGEAEDRFQDSEAYVQQKIERDGNAASTRLDNAYKRLKSMRYLYERGAVSEFRLFDAEDLYAERLQEFKSATQGVFFEQNSRSINQDFFLERTLDLSTAQNQLTNQRQTKSLELERLHLEMEKAQARLDENETLLDKTLLYAVTDGLISKVNVDAGDFYEIGEDALITLSQDVAFEAFVDQVRLDTISVGDPATVRLVAYPGQTFAGQVIRVNPAVETEGFRLGKVSINRQYTYSVWVKVDNLKMSPGLQGFVAFNPKQDIIQVPERAVTHLSGGDGMVMVIENGQAVVRQVEMGQRFDNTREIISGLEVGEQVVLDPRVLQPGDRVTPNLVDGEINTPLEVP